MDRQTKIANFAIESLIPILKQTLSERISRHYSEADWNAISFIVTSELSMYLSRSLPFADLCNEGDILNVRGDPNIAGVVKMLNSLVENSKDHPGKQAQIQHLLSHFKVVFGYTTP